MKKKQVNFGILVFPGSNCERDCAHVIRDILQQPTQYIWHEDRNLDSYDALILPGGFSYGDYLRTGAIARFSPAVDSLMKYVEKERGPVLGICNGFQILTESGLLPGALQQNTSLKFICKMVELRVHHTKTPFTDTLKPSTKLRMPIAHGEGNYVCDKPTLEALEKNGQILLTYEDNPNGSVADIAGVANKAKTVFGLMPHPERSSEALLGSADGLGIFQSIVEWVQTNS